jgi:hypothetical protein
MPKHNLWILSEERPKKKVIFLIIDKFMKDNNISGFINNLRIVPVLNKDKKFTFVYKILGVSSELINNIFIKIVSGYSSFVDYLLFYQDEMPEEKDKPIYGIEETKTNDFESRNTAIFQRASKFIILKYYYPNIKCIMLYNISVNKNKQPTQTNIFGTNCLLTLDVEILGKNIDFQQFKKFDTIEDVINFKNNMHLPPSNNVPILINKLSDKIEISGRLVKSGGLLHDPNIGALSLIAATIRKLGYKGRIVITKHGLLENMITSKNKFIQISNMLNLELDNLKIPKTNFNKNYWKYETNGEKLATIFIDITVENFTRGVTIFANHAGAEKGYFITKNEIPIPLKKYTDRAKYKAGDKSNIINIPDLILLDSDRKEIINIEGKKYEFRKEGIEKLEKFISIEKEYINKYYFNYKIIRNVVLYGGYENKIFDTQVGFLLNKEGNLILGAKAPELFKEAIKNLYDYWATND